MERQFVAHKEHDSPRQWKHVSSSVLVPHGPNALFVGDFGCDLESQVKAIRAEERGGQQEEEEGASVSLTDAVVDPS